MPLTVTVEVPPRDHEVLASWVRSPSIRAGLAQRARIVPLAADGIGTNEIVRRTGASKPTVILWKKRYAAEGKSGLEDRPRPGKPRTTDDVAIVLATLEPHPPRAILGQVQLRACGTPPVASIRVARAPDHLVANRLGSDRGQLQEAIHF